MNRGTKPVCRFFAQGKCKKGNDCNFLHSEGGAPPQQGNRPPPRNNQPWNPNSQHRNPNTHQNNRGRNYNQSNRRDNSSNRNFNQNPRNHHQNSKNKNFSDNKFNNNKPSNPENVKLSLEKQDLSELNSIRKNNGLQNMIIKGVVNIGEFLLLWFKTQNYVILMNTETHSFVEKPLYINCDINQTISEVKLGSFGDIPGEFVFINYVHFNNLTLKTYSKILITPKNCIDSHSNFLKLELSDQAPVNSFYIDQSIFVACIFNESTSSSEVKIASLHGIAENSSDLEKLSQLILSKIQTSQVPGKVSCIKNMSNHLILCLSSGELFVMNLQSNSSQVIKGLTDEAIFLEPSNTSNGELLVGCKGGEISLSTLGVPLVKRMTNQLNSQLLKLRVLQINQGKFNKVSSNLLYP